MSRKKVNSPNKFYFVWNYLEWGGAQTYFFGLMTEAKKNGEVLAIMPAGSGRQLLKFLDNLEVPYKFFNTHTDANPAPTIRRKLQRHWNKLKSEFIMLKYLAKLDFKNSVIHIELAPWQSFLAILWLCMKTKVFVTVHNSVLPIPAHRYWLWQIKFRILALIKNFHIFTANKDAKSSLSELVTKNYFEKITVINAHINPLEIESVVKKPANRTELSKTYNLPTDKFLVFCVGQFIDRKGRWIFLETAQKIVENKSDTVFVWISNSKPSTEDLQKADRYNLGKKFIFFTSEQVGNEHTDLFKLLKLADIFVLPSYLEGLPISLLEAMALGLPSISTNINGIPEAIKHLETGFLIEPGNSEALKNAILRLKDDAILRKKLSKNGREFVLANFNEKIEAKKGVEKYFEAYQPK